VPETGDLEGMAFVDPSICSFGDVEYSFDVQEHCLAVFVFGIEHQHLHTVQYFSVRRAVEDNGDFPAPLIQVVKAFLLLCKNTPAWWASYCPWYSLPSSMSMGLAVATITRQRSAMNLGQSLRTDM